MFDWDNNIKKHNELIKQEILKRIKEKLFETVHNKEICISAMEVAYTQTILDELISESGGTLKIEQLQELLFR